MKGKQPMTTNPLRFFLRLAALCFIFFAVSFSQKKFDVIFLKAGGKVVGTIVEKHEHQSVTLQLQSGEKLTFRWDEIKTFDVMLVKEKSIDEKVKEESANGDADFPWRLIDISGNELHVNSLASLSDTRLFSLRNDKSISTPIDSIAVLVHFKQGHFLLGAVIGFLVGAATGAIIGHVSSSPEPNKPLNSLSNQAGAATLGMVTGAIGGFLIGGIISAGDSYETYDLRSQKNFTMKRRILQQAIDD